MAQSNQLTRWQRLRFRLMRSTLRGLARLPRSFVDKVLVPALDWLLYHLFKYRRQVVEENIRLTLTYLSPAEQKAVGKRFYRHLAELMLHEARYAYGSDEQVRQLFRLEQTELLDQLYEAGHRQVFVLLGHIGPWELMGSSALHLDRSRYQLHVIYKQLHDPVADQLTHEMRELHHARCIEMMQLARTLIRHRGEQEGERLQMYCLLADQSPDYEQMRYASLLFGRTTPFVTGWSHLATKLQIPLLFYEIRHDDQAKQWVGTFRLLCEHPTSEIQYQLVDDYVTLLEENIRLAPHRWLWSHKRWRFDPHDFPQVVYSPRCRDLHQK
ncbi:lysophospholipid acyltransferase family protein [Porphyromonas uenonis]|uniref:lysophospholipid acyltransferase family protein n=1 Tax=Porphyromonas uenonis TaxID=281920 RepID=UPI0026F17362|nr:lysophospholipid acyltransferase family protein [Porphyromonas uenonis]